MAWSFEINLEEGRRGRGVREGSGEGAAMAVVVVTGGRKRFHFGYIVGCHHPFDHLLRSGPLKKKLLERNSTLNASVVTSKA